MLEQSTMEKLLAMRLHGMLNALKTQEQDPTARETQFPGATCAAGDQQWNCEDWTKV
jgi:hypothetical protein